MTTLKDFIAPRRGLPLVWGEFDCCLVMSDWVLARSGIDLMADLRGTYKGWKQAAYVWRKLGGVETAVSNGLDRHFPRVSISQAQPGDVGLIQTHKHACTAVIVDVCGVWAPTKKGYKLLRSVPGKRFWRIP
jgi:hypothetical protein